MVSINNFILHLLLFGKYKRQWEKNHLFLSTANDEGPNIPLISKPKKVYIKMCTYPCIFCTNIVNIIFWYLVDISWRTIINILYIIYYRLNNAWHYWYDVPHWWRNKIYANFCCYSVCTVLIITPTDVQY